MMNYIDNKQLFHYIETEQFGFLSLLRVMECFLQNPVIS